MRNISLQFFIVVAALIFSCNENLETTNEVPQSVIDKSLVYFEGEVIEKVFDQENRIDAWEIKIQNINGSIVKFYWSVNGIVLIKMEGQNGPFDYEIMPGKNLINFSTAQTIAKGAVKNENITRWELKEDEDFINKWVYSFEFDDMGSTVKVYIDALNGDVLQVD